MPKLTDVQWAAAAKEMSSYMAEKRKPHPRYRHVATHDTTGHKVGSHDGKTWFDHETGKPLK